MRIKATELANGLLQIRCIQVCDYCLDDGLVQSPWESVRQMSLLIHARVGNGRGSANALRSQENERKGPIVGDHKSSRLHSCMPRQTIRPDRVRYEVKLTITGVPLSCLSSNDRQGSAASRRDGSCV